MKDSSRKDEDTQKNRRDDTTTSEEELSLSTTHKGGRKKFQDSDEKYLGKRLPGTPRERRKLLRTLEEWLDDPEKGPDWVWRNRDRLLWEAEWVVNEGVL